MASLKKVARIALSSAVLAGTLISVSIGTANAADNRVHHFTSSLDQPTNLVMGLTEGNAEAILGVYKAIYRINQTQSPQITYRLLIPKAFFPVEEAKDLERPKQIVAQIEATLKSELGPEALKFWRKHDVEFLQYGWLQDPGESFWSHDPATGKWQVGFLDLNRHLQPKRTTPLPVDRKSVDERELALEDADFSTLAMEKIFQFESRRMAVPKTVDPNRNSNQGGNLEVMPDGTPYIGDTAPPEMARFIEQVTGKKPVVIPTNGLGVGHVDEIVTFIPSNHACGYSLLVASPLEGLQMARNQASSTPVASDTIANSLKYFAKSSSIDLAGALKPEDFDLRRPMRKYTKEQDEYSEGYPLFSDWHTKKGIEVTVQNFEGASKLAAHLAKVGACPNLQIVPVPVMPSFDTQLGYFQAAAEDVEKTHIHFSTPTPNLVVLGRHLIMADFTNTHHELQEPMKNETLRRLYALGYDDSRIHFVDASDYHRAMGSIHCGTQVVRRPKGNRL